MTRQEFIEIYTEIVRLAITFCESTRREGILSLDRRLSKLSITNDRDIFTYGIRLAVDGTEPELTEKILDNLIAQTEDHDKRTLKMIQKEAVLAIQEGLNTRIMLAILNSYTDLSLAENKDIINEINDIPGAKKVLKPSERDTGLLNIVDFLTDKQIQAVLRKCDQNELALSLQGASNAVREAFFRNMSPRAETIIKEDMLSMGQPTPKDIETAQKNMIALIKKINVD